MLIMKNPYIDIHCHVNFAAYASDRDEVMKRCLDGNTHMIVVGTQRDTSETAVALTEQYESGVYAIIGLHPIHTDKTYHDEQEIGPGSNEFTSRGEIFDMDFYRNLAQSGKVVGVGETGLDYYRTSPESLQKQLDAFHAQIQLALELDLPLMLHVRPSEGSMDAYHDVLDILEEYKKEHGDKLRGNAHFFAGDIDVAQRFLDLGFYLSFTGVITFAKMYKELVQYVPLDRIMSETDCPYVTPVPHRGERNEPLFVQEVTRKIAEWKGLSEDEVREAVYENAKRLFNL
jgi:TatD DNase family protein